MAGADIATGQIAFGPFVLDADERRLLRDGLPVDLTPRYFDALQLLAARPGALISKDTFNETVWRGMAVTDEALTQCIRTLRQALGDKAATPRFIETVPKHGYRFIAEIARPMSSTPSRRGLPRNLPLRMTLGGATAGLSGGAIYGLAGALQPADGGSGSLSALIVMVILDLMIGALAGAGIGCGLAAARRAGGLTPWWRWVAGGALGGLAIGAAGKLVIADALSLLLGRGVGDVSGGGEGFILGAGIGALAAWLEQRPSEASLPSPERHLALASLAGALLGIAIIALGGTLMAGSLALLSQSFASSHLRPAMLGSLFAETDFGPRTAFGTGALEGAVLYLCLIGALVLPIRRLNA